MIKKVISLFTTMTVLFCSINIVSAEGFGKKYVSVNALNHRTELNINMEGVGVRTVLGCDGSIKGNKIDVLVRYDSNIPTCGTSSAKVYLIN